jgi:predicted tellurium resistance membrane protein TerC
MDQLLVLATDPSAWLALVTLVVMEVVLGVDNLVFIALLSSRLPSQQGAKARRIGIGLSLVFRLLLVAGAAYVVRLTTPLFTIIGQSFSWRDLILIGGGLFLVFKATTEVHHTIDRAETASAARSKAATFAATVAQLFLLDLVFSIDSIITAVGMTEHVPIMIAAVIIAVVVMLVAAGPLADFIHRNPTIVMLALGFLLLIGATLIADGFGYHFPRGYVYSAMAFSATVEGLNMLARKRPSRRVVRAKATASPAHPIASAERDAEVRGKRAASTEADPHDFGAAEEALNDAARRVNAVSRRRMAFSRVIYTSGFFFLTVAFALIAVVALTLRFAGEPQVLKVAVGPADGDNAKLIGAIARHLERDGGRIRFVVLPVDDLAQSTKALEQGRADLAVIRSDIAIPQNGATVVILHNDIAVLAAPAGSTITKVTGLFKKRVGIYPATTSNAALLDVILAEYEIAPETVQHIMLSGRFGDNCIAQGGRCDTHCRSVWTHTGGSLTANIHRPARPFRAPARRRH